MADDVGVSSQDLGLPLDLGETAPPTGLPVTLAQIALERNVAPATDDRETGSANSLPFSAPRDSMNSEIFDPEKSETPNDTGVGAFTSENSSPAYVSSISSGILKKKKPAAPYGSDKSWGTKGTGGSSVGSRSAASDSRRPHASEISEIASNATEKSTTDRWAEAKSQKVEHQLIEEALPATSVKTNRRGTCREILSYKMDQMLSKRSRQCAFLVLMGCVQVIIGGLVYTTVWTHKDDDPRREDSVYRVIEGFWDAWTFMSDPGTHSQHMYLPEQKIVGSFVAVVGIIFLAAIIGVIVDVVREKMENLRQGRSKVVEDQHTLILGWTDKTILLIEEICLANESEGGGTIVVLASEKKEQMEVELKLQLPKKDRLGTKVVLRCGSPLLMGDLVKVSAPNARAVVILASGGDPDRADSDTLRCMLSLRSLTNGLEGHVVAEVRDVDNEPLVKLVGGSVVETLVSHDVLGRLMLMSARQPGLAKAYEALLGFEGDEFYMQAWPELIGLKFGDIPARFPDAIPIGIRSSSGVLHMKASVHRVIEPGDEIIVIAEDNDTYQPEDPDNHPVGTPPESEPEPREVENILFCGWRRDIRDIIQHLDSIVLKGSKVTMMSHCVPIHERYTKLLEEGLDTKKLQNLKIIHVAGNTSVRRQLENLPIETYTNIMILADQLFEADTMHADSHSLATLLLIRDIQKMRDAEAEAEEEQAGQGDVSEEAGVQSMNSDETTRTKPKLLPSFSAISNSSFSALDTNQCPIICEILDPRTQKTIAGNKYVSLSSDFCQTNRLVAQIMAMISEERSVKALLDELLGVKGCNLAVFPAERYCEPGESCSFYTVSQRARLFDEIIIGYQLHHSIEKTVLNPSAKKECMAWDKYDFTVVVGEAQLNVIGDEDISVSQAVDAFADRETRKALHGDVFREMRSSWSQTVTKDLQPGSIIMGELAVGDTSQIVIEEGVDHIGTFLNCCGSMNEAERGRFVKFFHLMSDVVKVGSASRRNQIIEAREDTSEQLLTSSCQDLCPVKPVRAT